MTFYECTKLCLFREEFFRMKLINRCILALFLVVGCSWNTGWAAEENITVEAEGYGSSRQDALLNAKRNAVSEGIGTVLVSETEVKNFMLIKDVVLTKTIGAVKRYTVLTEEEQPDNNEIYYIRISATVSMDSIIADLMALKILLESMDRPRMMVMIREEDGRQAETTITDYLTSKEFDLVDATTVAVLMDKEEELVNKAMAGDPVTAAGIGAENGAEYVLVGTVKTTSVSSQLLADTALKSVQAMITAKVINCSTGRVIASKSANSAAPHISADVARDLAVEKAARKLMDRKLFEKIVSSFQDMVNNGISLNVLVKNVTNFQIQKAVRQTISGLDVVSVQKRSFGGGRLSLGVTFRGNSDTFCEAVDDRMAGGKKLMVVECSGNNVVIVLE